jgi:hypothetical protein
MGLLTEIREKGADVQRLGRNSIEVQGISTP